MVCAILLSCAPTQNGNHSQNNANAPPRKGKLTSNFSLEELREIADGADNSEIEDVEVNSIRTLNKNYKDINAETLLFDETLRDEDARFDRLESAVQNVHNQLESITPGVNRLIAIEKDIKELHTKLSSLVEKGDPDFINNIQNTETKEEPTARKMSLKTPSNEPVVIVQDDPIDPFLPNASINQDVAQAEEIIEEKIQQIEKTIENGGVSMNLRAWESNNKTRIVFETPLQEDYNLNYDRSSQTVTISTDQKFAKDQIDMITRNSKQIINASVSNNTNATPATLTLSVQNVSNISSGYYLPPDSGEQEHRYYFDLFK